MEPFNIDTAVSLLPLMDDTENVTKQLISAIEVYNTHVDENTKPQLINFVLKTRLSESAKFKLGTESKKYGTVQDLLTDMKKNLLVKKSPTALQQQLVNSKQNDRNIEEYGKEVETLFMELTISQADGDTTKTGILKPLNEKLAIAQFAKGLSNKKLSTIVSARNYQTLKLAIQGAKDEEAIMFPGGNKAIKEGSSNVFHSNSGGRRGGLSQNNPSNRGYPSGPSRQNSGGNRGNHHAGGKPVDSSGGKQENTHIGKDSSIDDLFTKPQFIAPLNPVFQQYHTSHQGNAGGHRGGSHANRGHSGYARGGGHSGNSRGGHSNPCTSASLHGGGHSNRGNHNHGQNHSQKLQTHQNHHQPRNHSQNHSQKPHTNQGHSQKPHMNQSHPQKPHTNQSHPQKPSTTQNHSKPPANHNKNSGPAGNKNSFTPNKPNTGGNKKTTEILVKIKVPK